MTQPRLLDGAVDYIFDLQKTVKTRYEQVFIEKGLL